MLRLIMTAASDTSSATHIRIGGQPTNSAQKTLWVVFRILYGRIDDSGAPEDYDGGFGENSYFTRAMQKDD